MDYNFFRASQQQPQQQSFQFYGLPTPQANGSLDESAASHPAPFDATFVSFDSNSFSAGLGAPPQHSPPDSYTENSSVNQLETHTHPPIDGLQHESADHSNSLTADRRSSSEEKESTLTPAQSRRKEQNRAAQRAFRERKERHVRDLEQKLSDLEQASNTLHADNERLKQQLAKVATENEILRATSQSRVGGFNQQAGHDEGEMGASLDNSYTGPLRFSPTDFYASVLRGHDSKSRNPAHRIVINEETGERLLDAGATWDFIQNHDLFKRGRVDIALVSDRLKGHVKCDGQGPVFEEGQILRILEESVEGGNDELI